MHLLFLSHTWPNFPNCQQDFDIYSLYFQRNCGILSFYSSNEMESKKVMEKKNTGILLNNEIPYKVGLSVASQQ